jgi:hypothetical protein
MNPLERLQAWVSRQCDGDWEHGAGFRLETLDNPGWMLTVDLSATKYGSIGPLRMTEQRSEIDWIQLELTNETFVACGGIANLTEIVERFLSLVDR